MSQCSGVCSHVECCHHQLRDCHERPSAFPESQVRVFFYWTSFNRCTLQYIGCVCVCVLCAMVLVCRKSVPDSPFVVSCHSSSPLSPLIVLYVNHRDCKRTDYMVGQIDETYCRVAYPDHFNANLDPDPAFNLKC
jgi:hypothetical protein